ncbi:hypothetical protein M405DRAFT_407076 [Rhizopogon salebrosus TDB-379]|nr:hypothetical protein M405DRAFT_407076 [Rhizopogon salebrosus TDB-379]
MTGPLDLQKGVPPSNGQGEPTVFPNSAPPTPSSVDILLDLPSSALPLGVDMGNEGIYSSRLGIDFQAVPDEQIETSWSQQPTFQHQHEDQLSEQERCLPQWSVGVSDFLSQNPLDIPAGTSGDANNALSALTLQFHEGQLFEREHHLLLQESIEVSNPLSQHHSDLPTSTSGNVNYALGALTPQNYISHEKQTLCQQPRPVVVPGQKKVQCSWAGCSAVVRRDGLTRHKNEIHLRVVKATCTRCGKGFRRSYLKRNHEVTCRG